MTIEEISHANYWLATRSDSRPLPPETDKYASGLCIFIASPEDIVVQIRSVTPNQRRITHAYLNKSAIRDLIAALQQLETLL